SQAEEGPRRDRQQGIPCQLEPVQVHGLVWDGRAVVRDVLHLVRPALREADAELRARDGVRLRALHRQRRTARDQRTHGHLDTTTRRSRLLRLELRRRVRPHRDHGVDRRPVRQLHRDRGQHLDLEQLERRTGDAPRQEQAQPGNGVRPGERAMTFKDMYQRVQFTLGMEDSVPNDETLLAKAYINEGIIDVLVRTRPYTRCVNLNVSANTPVHDMSNLILALVDIVNPSGQGFLTRLTREDAVTAQQNGNPGYAFE